MLLLAYCLCCSLFVVYPASRLPSRFPGWTEPRLRWQRPRPPPNAAPEPRQQRLSRPVFDSSCFESASTPWSFELLHAHMSLEKCWFTMDLVTMFLNMDFETPQFESLRIEIMRTDRSCVSHVSTHAFRSLVSPPERYAPSRCTHPSLGAS